MIENTNRLHKMPRDAHLVREIAWISQNLLTLGLELHALALLAPLLHRRLDARHLARIIIQHLVHSRIKHVRATVDSRQPRKPLRQLPKPVQGVDVRTLAIPRHAVDVQPYPLHAILRHAPLLHVLVRRIQRHRMANEIPRASLQPKLVVHLLHRRLRQIHPIVRGRIILIERPHPVQKVARPPLLKQSHQRTPQRLARITRHLGHRRVPPTALLDIAARNLFELDIPRHIRTHQDVRELAIRHQQLGHEVDVPVIGSSVLLPGFRAGLVVAVLFEERFEVDGGCFAAVVVVAVHVQHFFAFDAHDAAEDAFGQAGAEDDDVVFRGDFVHGGGLGVRFGYVVG